MRVLLVGATGMLGTDAKEELARRGHSVVTPSHAELDITDPTSVGAVAAREFGDLEWCLNCAAYTAVDQAESELQRAYELNALGPGYLARACSMAGMRILHVSTDFVFNGEAEVPYVESDATEPLGAYGRTKWEGEQAVLIAHPNSVIARTSWLYGPNGNSFPRTMIRASEAGRQLRVVADQVGNPTYTADLARVLAEIMERGAPAGLYHAAGPDSMSWHEFAVIVLQEWAMVRGKPMPDPIEAIRTEDWPTPTKRPKYSVLSFDKVKSLGIAPMRPAREAVADFCRRLMAAMPA